MRFMAAMVFIIKSRSYLTGRLRIFSKSNVESYTQEDSSLHQLWAYDLDVLAIGTSESLGPTNLTRITLQIKVSSTFASAESENLCRNRDQFCPSQTVASQTYLTIISDKGNTMSRINGS